MATSFKIGTKNFQAKNIPQQERILELFDKLAKVHELHMLELLAQNLIKLCMSVSYKENVH